MNTIKLLALSLIAMTFVACHTTTGKDAMMKKDAMMVEKPAASSKY